MKKLRELSLAFLVIVSIIIFHGCKKEVLSPAIDTTEVSVVAVTTATAGGNITSSGGAQVIVRGLCWSTSQDPTTADDKTNDGAGPGFFQSMLTGLSPNTTYYVRAYATNSAGTDYGEQKSFTTLKEVTGSVFNDEVTYGTITDIEGNTYRTVRVGTQNWMAENLKTTKFNDGSDISLVIKDGEWSTTFKSAYCWYGNDPSFRETYGALYNWYAVNTGKLCPAGWHVPDLDELDFLIENFDYGSTSGSQLKEEGTSHWASPNAGATNASGWTALPGGTRSVNGQFKDLGLMGTWWATPASLPASYGEFAVIFSDDGQMYLTSGLGAVSYGISVRCILDK